MALKSVYAKLEDIPEAVRALYKQEGEKWVLDLDEDITEHPRTGALKRALEREREDKKKAAEKAAKLEADFEKYKDIDPEKAAEALAKLQDLEDKKLIDGGKVDELVAQKTERMRKDFETQLAKKDELIKQREAELGTANTRLADLQIFSEVEKAALKLGARRTAIDDIKNRARPVFKLVDGKVVAYKPGSEDPLYGKSGDPISIEEWVGSLATDADHLFEPNGGGGAGGAKTVNRAGAPVVVSRAQAGGSLEKIASGEAVIGD